MTETHGLHHGFDKPYRMLWEPSWLWAQPTTPDRWSV